MSLSYLISFQLIQNEKERQQAAIKIDSQTISHNIKHHIENKAEHILLLVKRWKTIDDINEHWKSDTASLKKLNPFIGEIKYFPIIPQPELILPSKDIIVFRDNIDKKRQFRSRSYLPKTQEALKPELIYISRSSPSRELTMAFDLQFPVIVNNTLIAYVEASINIDELLHHKIDNYQIIKPFSLSESGMTVFNSLPERMHFNDVTKQFKLPIYGREWTLMIWGNVTPHDKDLFLIFTLLISFLAAVCVKFISLYFVQSKRISDSDDHLKRVDDEFRNSKAKLIQSNKLTSLGEIATGIAHEINQPLQVICIHTDMCQDSLDNENYHLVEKSVKAIISQIDRIEKIVKQVGSFGRDSEQDNYRKEKTTDIFDNVIAITVNQYNQDSVELRQVIPPSLPSIYCNKTQIEQVLVNLLINAKDSVETSEEKVVFIKAHVQDHHLYVQISDSGTGIDPTKINDIFTPFYTTKPLGKGTGLGLSISYSIILQHKGEIKVSSEIGKGSVFTVKLPLEQRR